MSGKIRILALVLLLAGLLAPAASALPRGAAFPVPEHGGLTAVFRGWLSRLTAIWEKEGSSMDPNGQPQSTPPPGSTTEAGGDMDPNG